jgi:hypothetical protein
LPGPRASRLTPEYRWNEAAERYIAPTGRFVPQGDVRYALENVVKAGQAEMRQLAQDLAAGRIDVGLWQTQMAEQMKVLHTAAAAAARGGWAQMSQADWCATGQLLRQQYEYLQKFAAQVASGEQSLGPQFMRRAGMYGDAARNTHEAMRRRLMRQSGYDEERRVLGPAEHCDDCLEYAAEDWQEIGSLPPIGDSACLTNCHCHFEYRNSAGVSE